MFKILSKKEYEALIKAINQQGEVIDALADDNRDSKKKFKEIDEELHPTYFKN